MDLIELMNYNDLKPRNITRNITSITIKTSEIETMLSFEHPTTLETQYTRNQNTRNQSTQGTEYTRNPVA